MDRWNRGNTEFFAIAFDALLFAFRTCEQSRIGNKKKIKSELRNILFFLLVKKKNGTTTSAAAPPPQATTTTTFPPPGIASYSSFAQPLPAANESENESIVILDTLLMLYYSQNNSISSFYRLTLFFLAGLDAEQQQPSATCGTIVYDSEEKALAMMLLLHVSQWAKK